MEKRIIYADNAATTQVSKPVLEAMLPYLTGQYGNPSSIYALGRHAQRDIELARQQVAEALGCEPGEIFFTGCGTESDNWAIRSTAARLGAKGKRHIVTSVFEHHAVLHTCAALEKEGFEVTYLPVSREGLLTAQQVADAIRSDTALVSIMYANNEIGTIQPISEIAAVCREKGVLFHTDAVQAAGHVPINVREQGIDMLSLSGHKLHAQKGIGALYVRKGVPLPNLLYGGAQERGRRPGTENVPAIVGLGTAITLAVENLEEKMERVTALRNRLIDGILDIPRTRLNGDRVHRVPGNCNISILGIEGEFLLLALDQLGIMASSGSACTSGSLDPSHVLLSLGLCHEVAHGSLRLSISDETTREDVDYIIWAVHQAVERGRAMSPLWEAIRAGKVDYPDI
ncbi:cysteine desulfurase NifS [Ruminococcus sp. CAG:379]|uniref:cysteine desulfurase NifS n=1 Tax=Ruminococcus sp. CAG:379 TaxID=1262956 RepID=UPI000339FFEC|nr:cysteine desulfurase NifS [Ruminococcus sp. CAG:379]CDD53621.1 cysteine desulfurase NifS [Ruminococcus sp. CAG:379]